MLGPYCPKVKRSGPDCPYPFFQIFFSRVGTWIGSFGTRPGLGVFWEKKISALRAKSSVANSPPPLLLHTCILAYLHTCILAYLHTCILAYLHTCILAYLHTCILAYLHTCILAYLHTCILAYLHTCILAYLHTCILAYLYTSYRKAEVYVLEAICQMLLTYTSRNPSSSFWNLVCSGHQSIEERIMNKVKQKACVLSIRFYSPPRTQNVNTTFRKEAFFLFLFFFFSTHAGFCVSLIALHRIPKIFIFIPQLNKVYEGFGTFSVILFNDNFTPCFFRK